MGLFKNKKEDKPHINPYKKDHYYRLQVDGYDDVIAKYVGYKEPNHCKTCTCEGTNNFELVDQMHRLGKVDRVIEEVPKPAGV